MHGPSPMRVLNGVYFPNEVSTRDHGVDPVGFDQRQARAVGPGDGLNCAFRDRQKQVFEPLLPRAHRQSGKVSQTRPQIHVVRGV